MRNDMKAPPGAQRAGRNDEAIASAAATSVSSLPEQARRLAAEAQRCHPDLASWAQGFIAGWDAAFSAGVQQRVDDLAEVIALHHHRPWARHGAVVRHNRIRRELAEMEQQARPVRQTPDWPPVTIPGAEVTP